MAQATAAAATEKTKNYPLEISDMKSSDFNYEVPPVSARNVNKETSINDSRSLAEPGRDVSWILTDGRRSLHH